MKHQVKRVVTQFLLFFSVLFLTVYGVEAAKDNHWTEAMKDAEWEQWLTKWESLKGDWTLLSITPGNNESELNFAWYSLVKDEGKPAVRISEFPNMRPMIEYSGSSTPAVVGYKSNKVTIHDLKPNTTYYYTYGQGHSWSEPVAMQTRDASTFSFMVTSDPQIGASSQNIASGESEPLGQNKSVLNDAYLWNQTLTQGLKFREEAAFILNIGDQIQSRNREKEQLDFIGNEMEYVGFLSPEILKSIPIATVIGNHDSGSGNYSFHFNNPNAASYGKTMAGGGYYFSYGDVLFIVLNSNSDEIESYEQLMKESIKNHPDSKWRLVAMHHDIYGSGEHSNDPSIVSMRYQLVPMFEKYQIDVVLTGHDHVYTKSKFLKGAMKDESSFINQREYNEYLFGKTRLDERYTKYLDAIEDEDAIVDMDDMNQGVVYNPEGIIYYTISSATGSKYYELVPKQQAYIQARWQGNNPTFMMIDITKNSMTLQTVQSHSLELIDAPLTIVKD